MLALSTLISGCGAIRLAYGQGPDLSYWWLDGYADFNDLQTPQVRQSLSAWFRWHRSTQLPAYAKFLAQLQPLMADKLTAAQLCRIYDDANDFLNPSIDHALPLAAGTVQTFTDKQFSHMERKYEKVNREFQKDYLQNDPERRQKAAVKRLVERAEMLYGDLSEAQLKQLTKAIAASPFNPELWFEERVLRQQEALATFRRISAERLPAAQTQAALRTVVSHVQRSPRESYVAYQAKLLQYNCQLGADLHNSTDREQREAAIKKLKGWEDDARALAAEAEK